MNSIGWKTVKFGDVVENVRHNITDRKAAGIDRILGLDNIETNNLHVTGWKDVDSNPSFRTYFKPGQTLFGKRRAYLRKVAYAEFEGVCTQNILVFETKNIEVLLPEFLPFICMSEEFMKDAIKHSTGSLFPNANWQSIKNYEFRLPPLKVQMQISELLWTMNEYKKEIYKLEALVDELPNFIFTKIFDDQTFTNYTIGQLLNEGFLKIHKDGNHGSDYPRKNDFQDTGVPFLSVNCFTKTGNLIESNVKLLNEEKANLLKHGWLEENDVLLSHNATVGNVAIYDGRFERALVGTSLTVFRCNKTKLLPRFLYICLKSRDFQRQLKKMMVQSTRNQVPITTQKKLSLFIPSIKIQEQVAKVVEHIYDHNLEIKKSTIHISELFKSLINNIKVIE